MILSKDEVDFYNEKGYLLVEDVITEDQHNEMLGPVSYTHLTLPTILLV